MQLLSGSLFYSSEEKSLKTEISQKSSVSARMTKSIDLPADFGGDSKLLLHEVVTKVDVGDELLVVWTGLIWG